MASSSLNLDFAEYAELASIRGDTEAPGRSPDSRNQRKKTRQTPPSILCVALEPSQRSLQRTSYASLGYSLGHAGPNRAGAVIARYAEKRRPEGPSTRGRRAVIQSVREDVVREDAVWESANPCWPSSRSQSDLLAALFHMLPLPEALFLGAIMHLVAGIHFPPGEGAVRV